MAFQYKLEYVYDSSGPADASVYIQMRNNPPIYQSHIVKEAYDILPTAQKNPFLTGLFTVAGVVEVSTSAYRVWIMKSPVYSWSEVILPVLYFIASQYNETTIEALSGSGNTDGTGLMLTSIDDRRQI